MTEFITRRPKLVIFISVILTIILSVGIKWFHIDDDVMKMLPEEIPSRVAWNEVQSDFGSIDLLYVTVGHSDRTLFNPETFALIWEITHQLKNLRVIENVISISTVNRIENENGFLEIDEMQPKKILSQSDLRDIQDYLKSNQIIKKQFFNEQLTFTNIIVRPHVGVDNNEIVHLIKQVVDQYSEQLKIHYSGQPYLTGIVPELIREDVSILIRIGMIMMVIILLANLRSLAAVGMILSVIIMSLLGMLGLMGWLVKFTGSAVYYFTIVNSSMPIILLTIANSDGVHVITKFFREFRNSNGNTPKAITSTMSQLRKPIFLTSLTTAVAFLTLILSPITPLIGYGICLAFGIAWAWILSITLLPALISLKKWNPDSNVFHRKSGLQKLVDYFSRIIGNNPNRTILISLSIFILSAFWIFQVKVDVDYKNFFHKGTELRNNIEFMDDEMGGSMNMVIKFDGDLKNPQLLNQMDEIQRFLDSDPGVSLSFSLADIVKRLHQMIMDGDTAFYSVPDSKEKVSQLLRLYSSSADPSDFNSMVTENFDSGIINILVKSITTENSHKLIQKTEDFILKNDQNNSEEFTITGILVVIRDLANLLIQSSLLNIISAIFLIFVITWIINKSLIWGSLSILPLTFAVAINYGIMGATNIKLSHVTAILSSIIIGVGVDFAIHFIAEFKRQSKFSTGIDLTGKTIRHVGYPIFLDAGSNMAFGALLFSSFVPVQYIGGLMFFAMISCSAATLFLLGSLSVVISNKLSKNQENNYA